MKSVTTHACNTLAPTVRLNLNIDEEVYRHLKMDAADKGATISNYVRNLIMRELLNRCAGVHA